MGVVLWRFTDDCVMLEHVGRQLLLILESLMSLCHQHLIGVSYGNSHMGVCRQLYDAGTHRTGAVAFIGKFSAFLS